MSSRGGGWPAQLTLPVARRDHRFGRDAPSAASVQVRTKVGEPLLLLLLLERSEKLSSARIVS